MTKALLSPQFAQLCQLCADADPNTLIGRPHRMEVDGTVWSFALDGYHAVAYKGFDIYGNVEADKRQFYPQVDKASLPAALLDMLRTTPAGITINLQALKDWAGSPEWPAPGAKVDCDLCGGRGEITGHCYSCGRDEDQTCKDCEGTGKVDAPLWPNERRVGLLGHVMVDCVRLARCLDTLPGETATLILPPGRVGAIRIWADSWQVMVMSMNVQPTTETPRFELPEVAHV